MNNFLGKALSFGLKVIIGGVIPIGLALGAMLLAGLLESSVPSISELVAILLAMAIGLYIQAGTLALMYLTGDFVMRKFKKSK